MSCVASMSFACVTLAATLLVSGCTVGIGGEQRPFPAVQYRGPFSWPPKNYSRVIGYSFDSIALGESMIWKNGGLNLELLRKQTLTERELTSRQRDQLLGALLKSQSAFPTMRCYFPHHIFVFYSATNKPLAAIEVCFGCSEIRTWPELKKPRYSRWGNLCDFPSLARLADETGLGLGSREVTLQTYLQSLKKGQDRNNRDKAKFESSLKSSSPP